MSETVILAIIAAVVTLLTPIVAALVAAVVRGNQDAAVDRLAASKVREEMGRDIKDIHKQTNSAYEAVTVKADARELASAEKNDKRFAALEELFRSVMEEKTKGPAPGPPAPIPVTIEKQVEPVPVSVTHEMIGNSEAIKKPPKGEE